MIDFLFFVKTFILTVAIVLVMQIQVGDHSLENHTMGWVQSSAVAGPLNTVARGAAKLVHDITAKVWQGVHHNVGKNKKEETHGWASSFSWTHSSSKNSASQTED